MAQRTILALHISFSLYIYPFLNFLQWNFIVLNKKNDSVVLKQLVKYLNSKSDL